MFCHSLTLYSQFNDVALRTLYKGCLHTQDMAKIKRTHRKWQKHGFAFTGHSRGFTKTNIWKGAIETHPFCIKNGYLLINMFRLCGCAVDNFIWSVL